MKKNIDIIYQYLSLSAFNSMIKNGTLKLSDIKKSNDATELQLRFDILNKSLASAFEKSKPKYMEIISTEEFIKLIKEKTDHIKTVENSEHTQYVSCFSEEPDLLSQWRGYAQGFSMRKKDIIEVLQNNGDKSKNDEILLRNLNTVGGLAVGFSLKKLQEVFSSFHEVNGNITIDKVRYSERNQKALMRLDAEGIVKKIRKYVKENKNIDDFDWSSVCLDYHGALITKGALIKHHFFHEEKEWRVCMFDSINTAKREYLICEPDTIISNNVFNSEYETYLRNIESDEDDFLEGLNRAPSAYFYLYMGKRINELISKVIIGPQCNLSIEEIRKMLRENGIECDVEKSKGFDIFVNSANHKK